MEELVKLLQEGGFSCVIRKGEVVRKCTQRGVADLFSLYKEDPDFLRGSWVADKVVGKGAAALIALGGVSRLHAEVISRHALDLLEDFPIEVSFGQVVPYIINRAQTGQCPLETICQDAVSAEDCLPLIEDFRRKMGRK